MRRPQPQARFAVEPETETTDPHHGSRRSFLIIGGVTAIIVLGITIFAAVVLQPRQWHSQAELDFNQAEAKYVTAQESLNASLRDAAEVHQNTTVEQLDDPSVLTDLASLIDQGKELLAPAPDMAEKTKEIRQQVNELNTAVIEVRDMVSQIDTQVGDIVAVTKGGVDVASLSVGDCLIIKNLDGAFKTVPRVACTQPHDAEIIHVFTSSEATFSAGAIEDVAKKTCTQAMLDYVGPRHGFVSSRGLGLTYFSPSENSWDQGDRTISCLAYALSERSELTSSVQGQGK
ncbi:MAG: septum formation family protein [Propionibacteriaceae bacterium]|nr:septum formation family protein [Propionibacteriaceae bacterium]